MGNGRLTLGFLGLGDMGLPMAKRLANGPCELVVWNRTLEKGRALEQEGARIAETPAAVAAEADLIGLCLTSHVAVEEVAFGAGGLFTAGKPRMRAIADFSTGSVEAAKDFARRAKASGVDWIDSPV